MRSRKAFWPGRAPTCSYRSLGAVDFIKLGYKCIAAMESTLTAGSCSRSRVCPLQPKVFAIEHTFICLHKFLRPGNPLLVPINGKNQYFNYPHCACLATTLMCCIDPFRLGEILSHQFQFCCEFDQNTSFWVGNRGEWRVLALSRAHVD